jgi:signal peptidase II
MPEKLQNMGEGGGIAPSQSRGLAPWLGLAALVLVIDQISKHAVTNSLQYLESRQITEFFNLVLVYNTGAAFSLLADAPGWQRGVFIAIGVIASGVIVVLLKRHASDWRFCLALSLIMGGAIGNVWDRAVLGHVIDFIQLHAGGYYWPAFNAADSAICCGAGLLIWDAIPGSRQKAAK